MSNIKNINPVMITDDDKASVAIKMETFIFAFAVRFIRSRR